MKTVFFSRYKPNIMKQLKENENQDCQQCMYLFSKIKSKITL